MIVILVYINKIDLFDLIWTCYIKKMTPLVHAKHSVVQLSTSGAQCDK